MNMKDKKEKGKIRVNITVDAELLNKAKRKLHLFGGKVSTLFNSYLSDFVNSMEKNYSSNYKELAEKVKELEDKMKKLDKK